MLFVPKECMCSYDTRVGWQFSLPLKDDLTLIIIIGKCICCLCLVDDSLPYAPSKISKKRRLFQSPPKYQLGKHQNRMSQQRWTDGRAMGGNWSSWILVHHQYLMLTSLGLMVKVFQLWRKQCEYTWCASLFHASEHWWGFSRIGINHHKDMEKAVYAEIIPTAT